MVYCGDLVRGDDDRSLDDDGIVKTVRLWVGGGGLAGYGDPEAVVDFTAH